jgi:hypothetical protein
MRRNPHPKGVTDLAAFVATLNDREPVDVANGRDEQSIAVRAARFTPKPETA